MGCQVMKKWLVELKIMPKQGILDVSGRAIAQALKQKAYNLEDCVVGKFLKLKIAAHKKEEALNKAKQMASEVLCNALVEEYTLEIFSSSEEKI